MIIPILTPQKKAPPLGAFLYDLNSVYMLNLAFQRFTVEQTIPISGFLLSSR